MKVFLFGIIIAVCLYLFYKRGKQTENARTIDLSNVKTETLEGVLKMDDIVGIFKAKNLNPTKDTPFLSKSLNGLIVTPKGILEKPNYVSVVLGVNYESNIDIFEIIYAKAFDKKLEDSFANRDLITLS
jgi:hypothetical protein